jgi:2,3-bisphosphoglycerate-dependent phosphoglycerate mutase
LVHGIIGVAGRCPLVITETALGNSLRALAMVLDRHTTKTILDLNLGTGAPMIYQFNPDTTIASKLEMAA